MRRREHIRVTGVAEFSVPAPPIIANVVKATDPSQYRISITNQWDGGQPIIGYKVEYRAGGNWITTIENNESGEFHTVTTASGLPTVGDVEFRIYAINSVGISAASNIYTYENIIEDTTPPVITLTGGNITIDEGIPYSEPGFAASDNVDGDITANVVVNYGGLDINDPGEGVYTITYNVSDAAGNNAVQKSRTVTVEAVAVDTTPPSAPGNVQVINITYDEARVTWNASTDNVAVRGYVVMRLISGIFLNQSAELTDLFYDFPENSLIPGRGDNPAQYTIKVRAFDTSGNFADSASVTFETWSAPGTRGNTTITNISDTSVKIDWVGAVPGTFAIAGYNVYLNEVKLNTSLITATEYTFVDLLPGTEYTYNVECVDINGRSTGAPGTPWGTGSQFTTTGTAPSHNRLTNHDFIVSTGDQAGRRVGLEIYWCGNANAPLVVWCPGSGEYCRVSDASPINYIGLVDGEGLARYVRNGNEKPYNIISIQMPQYQSNWDHHVVNEALTQAKTLFPEFDINNVSGGGWSAGTGFAEWSVQYPHRTRVVFPMASWGFPSTQATVNTWLAAGVAVWAFHADPDGTITFNGNLKNHMVNSPSYNSDKHRFTRFTAGGHNIPDEIITGIGLASDSTNNYTPYPYSGNYSTLDDFILQWG